MDASKLSDGSCRMRYLMSRIRYCNNELHVSTYNAIKCICDEISNALVNIAYSTILDIHYYRCRYRLSYQSDTCPIIHSTRITIEHRRSCKTQMDSFIAGFAYGLTSVVVGQPLDT